MNVDDVTTSLNQDSEIQAIGVIEKNNSEPKYDWVGTYDEWVLGRSNQTIDDDWICYITDDGTSTKTSKERTLGEIIYSLFPINDPSLHLLDGTLIDGEGVYNQFYTFMKNLNETGYDRCFTTEESWQSSVSTYGVCGKFVYDSVNKTVRLPKITGIIEGTVDVNALGNIVLAGLPTLNTSSHSGHTHGVGTLQVTGIANRVGRTSESSTS